MTEGHQAVVAKADACAPPEVESHWKHVGSVLRESIRKIVQSIRTAVAEYLDDYGRDLKIDATGDGGSGVSCEPSAAGNSNELNDVEINGF